MNGLEHCGGIQGVEAAIKSQEAGFLVNERRALDHRVDPTVFCRCFLETATLAPASVMTWIKSTAESPEVRALEENCWSMWRIFGCGGGCRLVDTDDCLAFETPLEQAPYNGVLRFRPSRGDIDSRILELLAPYRSRGVPLFWLVHPTSGPSDLRDRLGRQGLEPAGIIQGMTRRLDDLPPIPRASPGFEAFEGTDGEVAEWLSLVSWRYNLPLTAEPYLVDIFKIGTNPSQSGSRTRWWYIRKDGVVLSKVVLHVGAGVAGMYGVSTRIEGRGQGLASILMLIAMHAARNDGLSMAVLHSTSVAVGLYERLGFFKAADFELWAEPGRVHI
jgi:hypothetical protein